MTRRAGNRHALVWSGEAFFEHDSHKIRFRDISQTGALVESAKRFETGSELFLDLGEAGNIFAKVSWARGDKYGLRFQEPFDLSRLALQRPTAAVPARKGDCPWPQSRIRKR